jgi:hypothetical protein
MNPSVSQQDQRVNRTWIWTALLLAQDMLFRIQSRLNVRLSFGATMLQTLREQDDCY